MVLESFDINSTCKGYAKKGDQHYQEKNAYRAAGVALGY